MHFHFAEYATRQNRSGTVAVHERLRDRQTLCKHFHACDIVTVPTRTDTRNLFVVTWCFDLLQ
jgi:hypothetical protein